MTKTPPCSCQAELLLSVGQQIPSGHGGRPRPRRRPARHPDAAQRAVRRQPQWQRKSPLPPISARARPREIYQDVWIFSMRQIISAHQLWALNRARGKMCHLCRPCLWSLGWPAALRETALRWPKRFLAPSHAPPLRAIRWHALLQWIASCLVLVLRLMSITRGGCNPCQSWAPYFALRCQRATSWNLQHRDMWLARPNSRLGRRLFLQLLEHGCRPHWPYRSTLPLRSTGPHYGKGRAHPRPRR